MSSTGYCIRHKGYSEENRYNLGPLQPNPYSQRV